MSALAVLLIGLMPLAPGGGGGEDVRGEVHHVLVLDDSGSMETDFDVHGFALAVPLMFVNCGVLHFFVARDRGGLNLTFAAAMVVVGAAANLILGGRLGAVGAAAATVVTEAALLACCLYALRVVRAVGHYGEMFERNLGRGGPLGLERGPNVPWTQGGLLYAPPMR